MIGRNHSKNVRKGGWTLPKDCYGQLICLNLVNTGQARLNFYLFKKCIAEYMSVILITKECLGFTNKLLESQNNWVNFHKLYIVVTGNRPTWCRIITLKDTKDWYTWQWLQHMQNQEKFNSYSRFIKVFIETISFWLEMTKL